MRNSLFDKLVDIGEMFVGPDKVDLRGRLSKSADGRWKLDLANSVKLKKSDVTEIELDNPATDIHEVLDGQTVSVRGRVMAKGFNNKDLVLEPEAVTPVPAHDPQAAAVK